MNFIVIQCSQLLVLDIMFEVFSKVSFCLSTHNQIFLVRMLKSVTSPKEVGLHVKICLLHCTLSFSSAVVDIDLSASFSETLQETCPVFLKRSVLHAPQVRLHD